LQQQQREQHPINPTKRTHKLCNDPKHKKHIYTPKQTPNPSKQPKPPNPYGVWSFFLDTQGYIPLCQQGENLSAKLVLSKSKKRAKQCLLLVVECVLLSYQVSNPEEGI